MHLPMEVKSVESNSILIVESINDKYFVESTKNYLNNIDLEIDTPVCSIDDYECLEGLSFRKLENKLNELIIRIEKQGYNPIVDTVTLQQATSILITNLKQFNWLPLLLNRNQQMQN